MMLSTSMTASNKTFSSIRKAARDFFKWPVARTARRADKSLDTLAISCPIDELYSNAGDTMIECDPPAAPDGNAFNAEIDRVHRAARQTIKLLKESNRWTEAMLPEKLASQAQSNTLDLRPR